jgi:cellulose synthase operon protein C
MAFRKARILLVTIGVAALLASCSKPEQRAEKYVKSGMEYLANGQFEKARVEFKNAGRIKPTDPDIRYRLALVDEAQGNIRAAFLGFREAENQNPRFAPALLKLAQYYLAAEHYDQVQQRLDIVLADTPDNAEAHAITAALMLRKNDHAAAEKEARFALQKEPGNTTAVAVLTGLYTAMEQPERAISVLEDGIGRHPKDVSLLQLRIALYRKLGDIDKAAASYEALFALKPDDPGLRSDLARMLLEAKRPDAAEKALRDAVAQDKSNIQMKTRLISFLTEVRGAKAAETQIEAFIKAEPDVNTYRFWLADLKIRSGDVDAATKILSDVATQQKMDPPGLTARAMLAKIDLGRGDRDAAERLVKEILERAPTNPDALFLRANLSFERGDFQGVVTDLRTILRDNPRNKLVYSLLAEALLRQGRLDLAIETLSQLRDLAPEISAGRVRLAQLYHMNGDSGRAMAELASVAEAQPEYPVVWESIARIAIPLKDWKAAGDAIDHLEKLDGQRYVAKFLRGELLAATGKDDDAVKAYAEVIQATPNTPLAENAVASVANSYRRLGKLDAGTKYLESLDLQSPASLTVLAECYSRLGKLDRAATAIDAALAQSPNMPGPYILRARLYLTDGQRVPATDVLKRGIEANPGEVQLPLMLADLLGNMGRVPEAIAMYESALQRNPSLDVAANNMAQLIADHQYSDPQALEKARRVAERFVTTTNPLFQDTLAWVYVRQGQVERALPILARITGEKGIPKQVNYHYGKALMMNGDKAAAKTQLEIAVSENRPYPGIEDARQLLGQM